MSYYADLEKRAQEIFDDMRVSYAISDPGFPIDKLCPVLFFEDFAVMQFGECYKFDNEEFIYYIKVGRWMLRFERILKNTIAHELAHIKSGDFEHGDDFVAAAKRIDDVLGTDCLKEHVLTDNELNRLMDLEPVAFKKWVDSVS